MSERRREPSGVERTAPTWVKILVGLHVFATVVWTLPNPPKAVVEGDLNPRGTQWLLYWNGKYLKALNPVRAYLFVTGAWQYWDMFAPDPSSTDWYCTTEIEYKDGTTKMQPYPRIYDLPIPEKFVKERYRKFYERAHLDEQARLWPSFAQTMALRAYTDRDNPPIVVHLRRHWLLIAAPGQPQRKEYQSFMYYSYAVDQRRLRAAAGMR